MKYIVTLLYDASESVEVEADSVDAAIAAAYEKSAAVLCHGCARHLDLGDVYETAVADENGNELDPTP